ncbi:hypothetical protein G5B47_06155 [Paenibacillus sp. 7124]|uniref:Uncharacterized protein n=1 Tax=Paenibacillus apii TaxID=1850370 RepID=A0A6M1PFA5_9BACL|nr:hypothetical protein [Paenibacillus apii]NGM81990.1 hypothetical protein [Paenibacillus apii]
MGNGKSFFLIMKAAILSGPSKTALFLYPKFADTDSAENRIINNGKFSLLASVIQFHNIKIIDVFFCKLLFENVELKNRMVIFVLGVFYCVEKG